jgi:hypothetical protein
VIIKNFLKKEIICYYKSADSLSSLFSSGLLLHLFIIIYNIVEKIISSMSNINAINAGPVVTGNGLPIIGAGNTLVKVRSK